MHQIELELQNEELQEAYAELKRARDRYADLYDFAPVGYLTTTTTTTTTNIIQSANLTFCRLIGIERENLTRKRITQYIDRGFLDAYYFHQKQVLQTGYKQVAEVRMHRLDGSVFYARLESVPYGEDQIRIVVMDITEEKRAKDALARAKDELEVKVAERTAELQKANAALTETINVTRELQDEKERFARRLINVQEEERNRISRELHDDTAQWLALVALEMDSIVAKGAGIPPETLSRLQKLRETTNKALREVRRFSHELRPSVLEHFGLAAALELIVNEFNAADALTKTQVSLNVQDIDDRLPEETELVLFRIAQESLSNIRKHARASEAVVRLLYVDSAVVLTVSDNGTGFDNRKTSAGSVDSGLGLVGMRERASIIGGKLRIRSTPGKGTTVSIRVPVNNRG